MRKVYGLAVFGSLSLIGLLFITIPLTSLVAAPSQTPDADKYIVLAWNDLGMHCYNRDFQYLAVLPPYNTLWAQVIRVGNPPEIITTGITVTYHFADNTYSVGKSNFWDYDQQLFAVDLPANVGLKGKGLSGVMDLDDTHFIAEGIPLTEFRDSDYEANPSAPSPYPYQLATVTVWDAATGVKLAETISVAPVSTEMHCDNCHSDGQQEGIATGSVELNILTLHDRENMSEYPFGHTGPLVNRAPILCAECHASNALGEPGQPDIPSLSNAMHDKHKEEVEATLDGCYQCHPGPQTQCLRDVMSQSASQMDCIDCHGTMAQVAQNPNPWLNEPRCDNAGCHDSGAYDMDQALYRMSSEHGGVFCEGCHDSPHAITPSREANDAIKFLALQGLNNALGAEGHCDACHSVMPASSGPHDIAPPITRDFTFAPDHSSMQGPGATVIYTHTLQNTGNVSDTYAITWDSSRQWAEVVVKVGGSTVNLPVTLLSGASLDVEVTVNVPASEAVRGQNDVTVMTATSLFDSSLARAVTDTTVVPKYFIYLPLVMRLF